jgi:hypothetical protein
MKTLSIFIFLLFGIECFAQETEKCNFILKENKFSKTEIHPVESIVGQDTITINELRFNCTICSCTTGQIMFDKFGKWNKSLPNKTLIWQNVKLFDDSDNRYTVATSGNESYQMLYSSIMVFDENNRDLLSDKNKELKEKIIHYFTEMIHNNRNQGNKFTKEYGKLKKQLNN